MSYPKWVSRGYGLGEILCLNEAEEAAVLKPAEPAAEPQKAAEWTVDTLRAHLDGLGIKYHHKAGLEKLKELLPK